MTETKADSGMDTRQATETTETKETGQTTGTHTRLKTLATCKPSEFLRQTYRIKRIAEKWLKDTDILNIRKNVPKLPPVDPKATPEDREEQEKENRAALAAAGKANFSLMFDAIAGEHPEETLELLALCCFVEPENVDDYEVGDYLEALAVMLGHRATINFFASSVRLVQILSPVL